MQEQATEVAAAEECEVQTVQARPYRIRWAGLFMGVFASAAARPS